MTSTSNLQTCFVYSLHFVANLLLYPVLVCIAGIQALLPRRQEANIRGDTAVVTGAAQGLGRKLAIELAKRGCNIAIVDIVEDKAKETANFLSETYKIKAKAYKVQNTNLDCIQLQIFYFRLMLPVIINWCNFILKLPRILEMLLF